MEEKEETGINKTDLKPMYGPKAQRVPNSGLDEPALTSFEVSVVVGKVLSWNSTTPLWLC